MVRKGEWKLDPRIKADEPMKPIACELTLLCEIRLDAQRS